MCILSIIQQIQPDIHNCEHVPDAGAHAATPNGPAGDNVDTQPVNDIMKVAAPDSLVPTSSPEVPADKKRAKYQNQRDIPAPAQESPVTLIMSSDRRAPVYVMDGHYTCIIFFEQISHLTKTQGRSNQAGIIL